MRSVERRAKSGPSHSVNSSGTTATTGATTRVMAATEIRRARRASPTAPATSPAAFNEERREASTLASATAKTLSRRVALKGTE